MTRKHSKRAHTNSRRSRSRHEEITGLQVMLGRMFALKVQCDLPEGLPVVLRRCSWTSAEKLMQRVQDGTFSSRKLAMVCFWARLGDQVFPGTEQEARPGEGSNAPGHAAREKNEAAHLVGVQRTSFEVVFLESQGLHLFSRARDGPRAADVCLKQV